MKVGKLVEPGCQKMSLQVVDWDYGHRELSTKLVGLFDAKVELFNLTRSYSHSYCMESLVAKVIHGLLDGLRKVLLMVHESILRVNSAKSLLLEYRSFGELDVRRDKLASSVH